MTKITPERRAEIAARCEEVYSNIGRLHPNVDKLLEADIPDLLSDNERLAEDLRRLRKLLKEVEWKHWTCPKCGGVDPEFADVAGVATEGHAPDCALDAELRAGG